MSAGLVRGRTLTSWPTLQDDVRNAGGNWVDNEVVCDNNWVSSRGPRDLPAFNREMVSLFAGRRGKRAAGGLSALEADNMAIRVRRAYDPPLPEDGRRVLVERLWPRGMKKESIFINAWLRELAPSDELRRWFKHDHARWDEFQWRYREELRDAQQQQLIDELAEQASRRNVTLIYSSREERFNSAVALCDVIEERMQRRLAA